MSTNFIYVISFSIFVFCAYKYGHKRLRSTLEKHIDHISLSLSKANDAKEKAKKTLAMVRGELQRVEESLKNHEKELELRINTLTLEHKHHLNNLVDEREKHHRALINHTYQERLQQLRLEIAQHVLERIKAELIDDISLHESFNIKSIELLKDIPLEFSSLKK